MSMHQGIIKKIVLFQNKDPNFIVDLAPILRPLRVKRTKTLWNEGDPPSEVYFVKKGKINFKVKGVIF